MSSILYEDKQVTITSDYVQIRKYYFPLATSRTILYTEVDWIVMEDAQGVDQTWGVSRKWLNNWFPYDADRKNKTKFIAFSIRGKKMKPTITPDDPAKVFSILNTLLSNNKNAPSSSQPAAPVRKLEEKGESELASSAIMQSK